VASFARSAAAVAASILCLASSYIASSAHAASFPVELKRSNVVQCALTGSIFSIDPVTGAISIDLDADSTCYPAIITRLNQSASLAVTTSLTVGGGTTGEGTVGLLLNTGLTGTTPGLTCVSEGLTASNVNITSGWPITFCTNCGATASVNVGVQHAGSSGNGSIAFSAKCTYQDPINPNLQTVRSNIVSAATVTVTPGTIPTPTACTSVAQLAVPNGLTPAMRQVSATVQPNGGSASTRSMLEYTSLFGTSANTFPPGATDTVMYGFPGSITGLTYQVTLERGKYVSLQFRAPSNTVWLERSGSYFAGGLQVYTRASIAPCPGQFGPDPAWPTTGKCFFDGTKNNTPIWQVSNGTPAACKLEPGKIYYLNVIQAYDSSPTDNSCMNTSCKFEIRNTHFY
jgi:hypothetical protein